MHSTSLDIRLAEPVVFLRGSGNAALRRRQGVPPDTAPAMVRGILTLKLAKATKIRSIVVSLEGRAKTEWPEGIGARRTEVTEDVSVLSSSTVFFRAGHEDETATSSARRAMSLGPGVGLDHEADDEGAISDDESDEDNADESRGTGNRNQGTVRAARGRRLSADQPFFQRHIVEHNEQTAIPTPPYTPRTSTPQASVPGSPRQTLQELRNVLRSDLANSRASIPSRPPSIHGASGSQSIPPRPTGPHEVLSAPPSHVPSTNVSSDASVKSLHENISEHPSDEEAEDHLPVLGHPSSSHREFSTLFSEEREAQRAHEDALNSPPHTERQRSMSRSTISQSPAVRSSSRIPHSPNHPRPILHTTGSDSLRHASSPSPHPSSLHATFHPQTDSPGADASPVRDRDRSESRVRGRQNTRFSLAAVSNVLHEIGHEITEITDRVRSKSRASTGPRPFGRGGAGSHGPRERDEQEQRLKDRAVERQLERERAVLGRDETQRGRPKERTALEKIGASLGLDVEPDSEADMWQEFKKGTYNYPISFAVPANTPPTLHCDFGSISYRLKAVVHRTGTFVPKLVAHAEVTLISCPGEDDTEERENIVVERQWDEQLRYFITISGKSFPIGGVIPITLVMMPLSKVKIYRLTVMLEEKIDYYAHGRRVARHDPTRRYELMSLKHPNSKNDKGTRQPLLPVLDDSNDAISRSPLASLIEGQDPDEIATNLLNPNGPWTLQLQANLPTCSSPIHFTCKHTRSNMIISHWIKIMIRVERGDDAQMDKGKRKQFDIIVETPVHILSCKCSPDYTALPPYSLPSLPVPKAAGSASPGECLCDHAKAEQQNRLQTIPPPTSALPTQSPISGLGYSPFNVPAADFAHPPLRRAPNSNPNAAAPDRIMGGMAVEAAIGHGTGGVVDRPQAARSHDSSERITTLVDRSLQFERLVSGGEGVAGDMPPAYSDAVEGAHHGEERGRVMFSEATASRQGSRSRPGSRSRAGSRSRPGSRPASRPVSRTTSMVWA